MSKQYKICHLTSAHPWEDIRIFHKECSSLAKNTSYDVFLVSGKGADVSKNDVRVYGVESAADSGRFSRMRATVNAVYSKALELDADLYHIHDPELLRIAIKLKRKGKKVVYDAHEDLPRQILGKYWIPKWLRKVASVIFERYENWVVKKMDAVVAATPFIKTRFGKINPNTIDVNNYPILSVCEVKPSNGLGNYVCYAGGITANRGILSLVQAMDLLPDVQLKLAGIYSPETFRDELVSEKGWSSVQELGYIGRSEVKSLIKHSIAGIVTLKPLPNYLDSLPIKMFEYMYEGIPVIASNFPYWRTIIENDGVGLCVNPDSPEEIADAIKVFMNDPLLREKMGKRGREMVLQKYNWGIEERKLMDLYRKLLG